MTLFSLAAAILNLGAAVLSLPVWVRAGNIAINLCLVAVGLGLGDALIWALHLSLIPLNAALLFGALGGRSA